MVIQHRRLQLQDLSISTLISCCRRHDYNVNVAGGFGAAQLTSNYIHANGIGLPSKRRAYTRGPDNRPILDMLMVFIDISNVSFT